MDKIDDKSTRPECAATPKISIIVPVYNVERYLCEALDSTRAQTFTDWECILVDDGSPDSCGQICDQYAAADSRFRVVHRPNGGLSAARNSGLREARAPYISFLDSDDTISPDFLSRLYELITTYDADMAQVGAAKVFTTGIYDMHLGRTLTLLDQAQFINELLRGTKIPNYMWNKLFRREVITTGFPEGQVYEDIYALSNWIGNIHKVVLTPEPLYLYRQRRGSIIYTYSLPGRLDYLKAFRTRAEILRKSFPELMSESRYQKEIWRGIINCAKTIARKFTPKAYRLECIEKLHLMALEQGLPPRNAVPAKLWYRANLLLRLPRLFIVNARLGNFFKSHNRRTNHLFD